MAIIADVPIRQQRIRYNLDNNAPVRDYYVPIRQQRIRYNLKSRYGP